MLTLTTVQMKRAEQLADEGGLSYRQMMENAGRMAFEYLNSRYVLAGKRCLILAGNGNNAGDGFVLAQRLREKGLSVTVLLCCGLPQTPLAKLEFRLAQESGAEILEHTQPDALSRIASAQVLVDAVFGTGFRGELPAGLEKAVDAFNESPGLKAALDIPSGVNADTGASGRFSIRVDLTLAFGAYKPAHTHLDSRVACGQVEVLDIGIPEEVVRAALSNQVSITSEQVRQYLPPRPKEVHKGCFGKLLNLSGSLRMPGAAMMSTLAALRTGAGVTTLAAPAQTARMLAPHLMEAISLPLPEGEKGEVSSAVLPGLRRLLEEMTVCLIGCGLSVTEETRRLVAGLVEGAPCRLVLDADALNCISQEDSPVELLRKCWETPVITPHPGEMARLTGLTLEQVRANTVSAARLFAKESRCVVVLKGHHTLIAAPEGELYRNTTGNAGLAKGGSGDVLAGMIAALAAQGLDAKQAAVCGVYLHGLAADRLAERMGLAGMLARDVIEELPAALKSIGR